MIAMLGLSLMKTWTSVNLMISIVAKADTTSYRFGQCSLDLRAPPQVAWFADSSERDINLAANVLHGKKSAVFHIVLDTLNSKHRGNYRGIYYVFSVATPGQVNPGFIQALQDGPNGMGAAQMLGNLVGDIS